MSRLRKPLTGIALAAALTMAASGTALAYFTATGVGTASAGVSELAAPTITAADPGTGGTVALAWNAVTPPGPGTVTYTVSRDGDDAEGSCISTLIVSSCMDSGLVLGTHTYVVTAKWRTWTVSSAAKTAKVVVGPADHFQLTAASSAPAAGAADNLTITAKDASGNTATTYTGSHSLTFSGASASAGGNKPTVVNGTGSAINFGSATTIGFSAGVATVSSSKNGLMKLYASGETDIDVSDGTISTETPLEVTVSPGAASKLVLTAVSTAPTAGSEDDLTVTAQDTYGNAASTYTGARSLTFSGASESPGGTAPTVSDASGSATAFGTPVALDFAAGLATASSGANGTMALYKSGSTSVKASDGSISTAKALSVTVSPAPASELLLATSSTTPVAGASANLTATARDAYGNTDSTYTGLHSLTFSGASASPSGTPPTVVDSSGTVSAFGSPMAINFSAGVAKVGSGKNGLVRLYRAEPTSITVSDGSISNPTPLAVTVSSATASKWAVTNIEVSAGTLGPTCLFTCTLIGLGNGGTVKAKVAVADTYGNTVNALGSGHAAKVTTGSGGGTISGTPLAIPSTGAAESATSFTFTSKSAGNFSETLTVEKASGMAYTPATLTASR